MAKQPKNPISPGDRFGRLVILENLGIIRGHRRFSARCDCGVVDDYRGYHMLKGHTKSCGCFCSEKSRALHTKHGMYGTSEYNTWQCMLARCHRPTDDSFFNYGARGITVCAAWRNSFAAFYADMGPRPSSSHTLDRIDNSGNYEPGNCRWATPEIQANNTRKNVFVCIDGQRKTVSEWAALAGVRRQVIERRLRRGEPLTSGILRPTRKLNRKPK